MKCRSVLTRIDALRTAELQTFEAREVEEHLGRCASCHDSADDVASFASAIRSCAKTPGRSLAGSLAAAVGDAVDCFEVDGQNVYVAFSKHGIRLIDLRAKSIEEFRRAYAARFGRELHEESLSNREREAIELALRGKTAKRPEIDLSDLTEFEQKVLHTILNIPRGEVRTYEWVARAAGRPKAIRAVGNVMATNPVPFLLPCHRVVPTAGGIGNYGFGSAMKRTLLAAEGAPVEELETLAQHGVRFIGSRTTKIFCCPTCRDARRIRQENRVGFHDAAEARHDGYRPCKRCAPAVAA
ncbi:MAG TPA: methylated-DNA--[protein]-cysteine S-methyltransferase [Thermoanaerobaculia bacterium]|nr:methylated-DNA--[protein]-cysteine S-methyltransferase [Thermoanaerobaculia bacterium]